ncbi:MAG: amidohydrolase [Lentisphaerae bacterium]|nr:amidohydrolase [Lentisphaerota bacterium]
MFKAEDFEIIDMHVHPIETAAQSISRFGSVKDADDFDAEMRRAGVSQYAGSVLQKGDPDDFKWIAHLNRIALRLRDRFPRYIPGIHVHGKFVEESCAELHAMKAEGVKLVGELVPYYLGTGAFDTPGMLTLFHEMAKLGMIANLHHVSREEAEILVREVPEMTFIFAHPGEAGAEWGVDQRMQFVAEHENIYMDISGTGLFRWDFISHFVEVCGAEKILFGSDMPVCNVGMNLYGTLFSRINREAMQLILAGNFKRIMGM